MARPQPDTELEDVNAPIPLTSEAPARSWVPAVVGGITVLVAVIWYAVVNAALQSGARVQSEAAVNGAQTLFQQMTEDVQLRLRTESQLMSEDPRLKSTLATPGIDEATIQDVLMDLRRQTSAELLAVLTPTARVQAEVGASYMRGLDLSTSSVIKGAQTSAESVAGTWVVGDRVLDVSAKAVRFGNQLVAYLVVGAPLTDATFKHVHDVTQTGVALLVAGKVALAAPPDGPFPSAFGQLAGEASPFETQAMNLNGTAFVARLSAVNNTSQARIAVLRPARESLEPYEKVQYLAWLPTIAAVVFAVIAILRGRLLR